MLILFWTHRRGSLISGTGKWEVKISLYSSSVKRVEKSPLGKVDHFGQSEKEDVIIIYPVTFYS